MVLLNRPRVAFWVLFLHLVSTGFLREGVGFHHPPYSTVCIAVQRPAMVHTGATQPTCSMCRSAPRAPSRPPCCCRPRDGFCLCCSFSLNSIPTLSHVYLRPQTEVCAFRLLPCAHRSHACRTGTSRYLQLQLRWRTEEYRLVLRLACFRAEPDLSLKLCPCIGFLLVKEGYRWL